MQKKIEEACVAIRSNPAKIQSQVICFEILLAKVANRVGGKQYNSRWPGADMYMYILHDIEPLDTGHIFKMCFGGVPAESTF